MCVSGTKSDIFDKLWILSTARSTHYRSVKLELNIQTSVTKKHFDAMKTGGGSCPSTEPPPGRPPGGSCSLSKSVTINGDATKYLFHAPKDLGPRPPSRPRHPSRPSYPPFPYLSPEGPRTAGRGGSSVPGGPQNRGGGEWGTRPHPGRS